MRRSFTSALLLTCLGLGSLPAVLTATARDAAPPTPLEPGEPGVAPACLMTPFGSAAIKPGVPLEEAMREMEILLERMDDGGARFQPGGRWGPDSQAGAPVSLTYSFPSDGLIVDGNINGTGDFQPNVLHERLGELFGDEETWKQSVRDMFDSWTAITGNVYTEVSDDDAPWGTRGPFNGSAGRGDVRLVMVRVTPTQFFAFNFFPDHGDMVIDSEWPWGRFGGSFPEWRNMLAHEHGHGQGLFHTCPQDGTKLMEPTINTGFIGPQLDDALSAQFLYGDRLEPNQTPVSAVDLAALGLSNTGFPLSLEGLSLHSSDDVDLFRVQSFGGTTLTFQVSPTGTEYIQGPQTSACDTGAPFDTLRQADLVVDILRPDFGIAETIDFGGLGQVEGRLEFMMDEPGDWFVQVRSGGFNPSVQAYFLGISTLGGGALSGDLTGDGCVNSVDLAVLIAQWYTPGADINGDSMTDSSDLAVVLATWSPTDCGSGSGAR